MHYPLTFELFGHSLHVHLIMEILSYTLGYRLYVYLRRHTQDAISTEGRMYIFIAAAFGAFWGSHLLGIVERPLHREMLTFTYFGSNKTIVGGLLGGLIGVEAMKYFLKIRHSSGDLMTYPLLFGLVLGRLGCHFEGLDDGTFGLPTHLPWGIDFGDGVRRHPVNLYEILYLGLVALLLFLVEKKWRLPDGMRFALFLSAYLLYRFGMEYLKPVYFYNPPGFTAIQMVCAAGLLYYIKKFAGYWSS